MKVFNLNDYKFYSKNERKINNLRRKTGKDGGRSFKLSAVFFRSTFVSKKMFARAKVDAFDLV